MDNVTVLGMDLHHFIGKVVFLAVVAVAALFVQRVLVRLAKRGLDRANVPSASIFINILRVVIWFFALACVLQPVFGVSPNALITALGVTSLTVSLGMQDTISNIVGGIGLMFTKVVQPGDYVTVNSNTGIVTDVTWRHTIVRDRDGNAQVIPNSVLNKQALTRLTPLFAERATLDVTVKPGQDLAQVSEALVKAVNDALGDKRATQAAVAVAREPKEEVKAFDRGLSEKAPVAGGVGAIGGLEPGLGVDAPLPLPLVPVTSVRFTSISSSGIGAQICYHVKASVPLQEATDVVVRALAKMDCLA